MAISLGERRVLSPTEVTVDKMDVEAVVTHVFDAFRSYDDDDGWQFSNTQAEVAGSCFVGCCTLMRFSAKMDEKVDSVGRLQPGAFERPTFLESWLLEHNDYRSLALLSEWKPVAAPTQREDAARASQMLLVRQDRCNWEEVCVTLELRATPAGKRWVVVSLYKDYHDPAGACGGASDGEDADPEEARNC